MLDASPSPSNDDRRYKYLIRKRDGTFYSKKGGWVKKKEWAKHIAGADNAWHYAEHHLWEYIEEIDVVIP